MWAHCLLMDCPGTAGLGLLTCQSAAVRALLWSPVSWVPLTLPPIPLPCLRLENCQVQWNTARWSADFGAGAEVTLAESPETNALWAHFAQLDFRFCPASLFGIVLHYFFAFSLVSLPPYTCSFLPRALFNFKFHLLRTVCLSFPFLI